MLVRLHVLLVFVMAWDGALESFLNCMHLLLDVVRLDHGACVLRYCTLNLGDHLLSEVFNKHGKLIVPDVLQILLQLWNCLELADVELHSLLEIGNSLKLDRHLVHMVIKVVCLLVEQ